MKFKTNYLYLLFIPLVVLGFYRIFNPPSQDDKTTEQEVIKTKTEFNPTTTLESLKKLGINISLWTESKKDFERIHDVELEKVSNEILVFVDDVPEHNPYHWSIRKQWMKLEGNKTELFTNNGKNFVVIGSYGYIETIIGDYGACKRTFKFGGDLYRYKTTADYIIEKSMEVLPGM
ncbi:MAG: hypothetical protein WAZ12_03645 [Candidatus Absconditicoccaceae bacterium]